MFNFLRSLFSKKQTESLQASSEVSDDSNEAQISPIAVTYDVNGIALSFEGEMKQSISWTDIDLIAIRIEDEFFPFPYWYVGNKENLLRIPNDAVGADSLFFDGFSQFIAGYKSDATFKVIIEASSAIEGSFIVWSDDNAQSA